MELFIELQTWEYAKCQGVLGTVPLTVVSVQAELELGEVG